MNKVIKLSLAVVVSLLAACSHDSPYADASPNTSSTQNPQADQADKDAQQDAQAGKDDQANKDAQADKDASVTKTGAVTKSTDGGPTPKIDKEEPNTSVPKDDTKTSSNTHNTNTGSSNPLYTPEPSVTDKDELPIKGYAYTLSGENFTKVSPVKNIESKELDTLNVDGQAITLLGDAIVEYGGHFYTTDNEIISGVDNYFKVRYGIVPNELGEKVVFVQGEPTAIAEMPKKEIYQYYGGAVIQPLNGDKYLEGRSSFVANFAEKTLAGSINDLDQKTSYNLEAKITNNTFEGIKDGVSTKGMFYGRNATELGGVFSDGKSNTIGVYGAGYSDPDPNSHLPQ